MYTIKFTPKHRNDQPLIFMGQSQSDDGYGHFCGELSDLDQVSNMGRFPNLHVGARVQVENTMNGNVILFECDERDTDGEDIYGWRFRAIKGHTYPVKMLLIND